MIFLLSVGRFLPRSTEMSLPTAILAEPGFIAADTPTNVNHYKVLYRQPETFPPHCPINIPD